MPRECTINKDGGSIAVSVKINNGAVAAGRFDIFVLSTGQVIEPLEIKTGVGGSCITKSALKAAVLPDLVMQWELFVCAMTPATSCVLNAVIMQNEKECILSTPIHFELKDIPNCEANKARKVTGSLKFKLSAK